jgi:nucleotide-binding universal stress UspA family protein
VGNLPRKKGAMPWTTNVLVVANVTATSPELIGALVSKARSGPARFRLVIPSSPAAGGRPAAEQQLAEALERLRAAGLDVEGTVASIDPLVAVSDEWDARRYDEVVLSTLPLGVSRWLHAGLPERVARLTGARVTHVVAEPAKPRPQARPVPEHVRLGVMAPLLVLGWGRRRDPKSLR